MKRIAVDVWHTEHMTAAGEIPFGSAVKYSAAGTVVVAVDGANTRGFIGIAEDDIVEKTQPGCYSTYDPVPVIVAGIVYLPVVGGGTDVAAGDLLKLANDSGLMVRESATTEAVSTTCARALEDAEVSNYTTAMSTATAGAKTATVTSTAYFLAGDMVYLQGATDATATDSEVVQIATVDSTTQVTFKTALKFSYSSQNMKKLVQVKCLLRG
jgi:hypothetical protein